MMMDGGFPFKLESFASKEGYEEYLESMRTKPARGKSHTRKEWWK